MLRLRVVRRSLLCLFLCLGAGGCYKDAYLNTRAELDQTRMSLAETQRQAAAERASLRETISGLTEKTARLAAELAAVADKNIDLELLLKQQEAKDAELRRMKEAHRAMRAALERLSQKAGFTITSEVRPNGDELISINVNEKILFNSADWRLSREGGSAIAGPHKEFLQAAIDFDPQTQIGVIGHTDSQRITSRILSRDQKLIDDNYVLGYERAVSVAERLGQAGISKRSLRVESRSQHDPLCKDAPPGPECHARNRRVEYEIFVAEENRSRINYDVLDQ